MKARDVSITAVFGALYASITIVFAPISFLQYQVRLSEALKPMGVSIFGYPAIIGLLIGQFIANFWSPLGFIDLLSPIFAGIGLSFMYLLRKKSLLLGCILYCISISLWVAYMLQLIFQVPIIVGFTLVMVGEVISVILIGYPIKKAMDRLIK